MERVKYETTTLRVSKKFYEKLNETSVLTKIPKTQICDMLADDKYWPFVLQKRR